MDEKSPNTDLYCNLCEEKIASCCMLSPDWSLKSQLENTLETLRMHFKDKHNIERPRG